MHTSHFLVIFLSKDTPSRNMTIEDVPSIMRSNSKKRAAPSFSFEAAVLNDVGVTHLKRGDNFHSIRFLQKAFYRLQGSMTPSSPSIHRMPLDEDANIDCGEARIELDQFTGHATHCPVTL